MFDRVLNTHFLNVTLNVFKVSKKDNRKTYTVYIKGIKIAM